MKVLIIYCSEYKKNTEKIAQVFAKKIDCDLVNVKDANDIDIEGYDLIGFGSGVYKESLSPKIFKMVDRLDMNGKDTFVFSTSGVGMKYYNNSLIKHLESKGANIKGSFACIGSFVANEFTDKKIFNIIGKLSKGHPNNKDFNKAGIFIKELVDFN